MVEDHQMTALQRIAEFSARVRGHQPKRLVDLGGVRHLQMRDMRALCRGLSIAGAARNGWRGAVP